MLRKRIIPCLLLHNEGLVKSRRFKKYIYLGDPINAIKIFNEKEVDELIILDIDATKNTSGPNYKLIEEIASECFMPLTYGGGIKNIRQIEKILRIGVEKICINTEAFKNSKIIEEAARDYGEQSVIISIDVKKNIFGKYEIFIEGGKMNTKEDPVEYAKRVQELGAGELLVNSIDCDGMMQGYDKKIIIRITESIKIPVIACGGAGKIEDMLDLLDKSKVSAAAGGSIFVFHGRQKAVLIKYPTREEIEKKTIIS